ncbi:hypothetical protein AB0M47_23020 [Hamadaea sp. NPDC051192]|uniref:phenylacetate--CoA ligase family protein n=1 Tax=Hamadaea sp. NPDC051192 TaxID=3154940 RepID=UPI0034478F4B
MTRLPHRIPILPVLANVATARARDRARPERIAELQARLLTQLVRHAAATVPHYREVYDPAVVAEFQGPQDLSRLPLLDRATVNALGPSGGLLAAGHTAESTRMASTSGSTGHPATFYYSEQDLGYLRATFLWDLLACGMRPWDRVGYFRVYGFRKHRLERLGLAGNVHVDTSKSIAEQADAVLAGRPTILWGFPSMIAAVGAELRRRGIRYPHARVIVFAGESTLIGGRTEALEYFGATAHETYASVEAYTIARTCSRGNMHLRSGDVVVEVIRDDGSVTLADGVGEIVVTRLHAEANPLIRYRLGDRVEITPNDCDCGTSHMPILRSVLGRVEDRIETKDGVLRNGNFIASLIYPLSREGRLLRIQMVQERPGELRLLAVATDGAEAEVERQLRAAIAPAASQFDLDVAMVDTIAPEPNGKIRLVKRL